ncbi:hypothetical protein P5704_028395 (plasmid) [Pseudomonas sp. FeN3W]|nr:hypothetical protein P5704_028395 [Pseudomonas sp. FeN3W]
MNHTFDADVFRNGSTKSSRWSENDYLLPFVNEQISKLYSQGYEFGYILPESIRQATGIIVNKALSEISLHDVQHVLKLWKADLSDLILMLETSLKGDQFNFIDARIEISFGGGIVNYDSMFKSLNIKELAALLDKVSSASLTKSTEKQFICGIIDSSLHPLPKMAESSYAILKHQAVQDYVQGETRHYHVSNDFLKTFTRSLTASRPPAPTKILKYFVEAMVFDESDKHRNFLGHLFDTIELISDNETKRHKLLSNALNNIHDKDQWLLNNYTNAEYRPNKKSRLNDDGDWVARYIGNVELKKINSGEWVNTGWRQAMCMSKCDLSFKDKSIILNNYVIQNYSLFRDENYSVPEWIEFRLRNVLTHTELYEVAKEIFTEMFAAKLSGTTWDQQCEEESQYLEAFKIIESLGLRKPLTQAFNESNELLQSEDLSIKPGSMDRMGFLIKALKLERCEMTSNKVKRALIDSELCL